MLTRSVRDTAALLDATAGIETGAPYVAPPAPGPFLDEVGRDPGACASPSPSARCSAARRMPTAPPPATTRRRCCADWVTRSSSGFPSFDATATRRAFLVLVAVGVAAAATRAAQIAGDGRGDEELEAGTRQLVAIGRRVSAVDYAAALDACHAARRAVAVFMEEHAVDVLLTSTLAFPPPRSAPRGWGPSSGRRYASSTKAPRCDSARLLELLDVLTDRATEWVGNTALFNVTGQPAISLPLWWSDQGLPIGVQFAARYGDEASLLRLAGQLEQARPWQHRATTPRGRLDDRTIAVAAPALLQFRPAEPPRRRRAGPCRRRPP